MPMMRSPFSASSTICRYRGSKMCSGRNTLGKSTTFGSGKIGMVGGSMAVNRQSIDNRQSTIRHSALCSLQASMYGPWLLVHVVHEDVAAERARRGEVRLAVADFGDLAHEADEIVVAREHERVDQDARLAAGGDLGERLRHDVGVEAERVAVDTAVGARQRRRLPVGDHD